jgi:hypothetical protein
MALGSFHRLLVCYEVGHLRGLGSTCEGSCVVIGRAPTPRARGEGIVTRERPHIVRDRAFKSKVCVLRSYRVPILVQSSWENVEDIQTKDEVEVPLSDTRSCCLYCTPHMPATAYGKRCMRSAAWLNIRPSGAFVALLKHPLKCWRCAARTIEAPAC